MALDEFNREIGKFSQEYPEKFGKIKQKALDLGISTRELFAKLADSIDKQQQHTPQQPNNKELDDLQDEVKKLVAEVRGLRDTPPQPAPTQSGAMSGVTEFAQAMTAMKQLESTLIGGYEAMLDKAQIKALESLPADEGVDAEAESPEDYAMKKLSDVLVKKFEAGSGQQQAAAPTTTSTSVPAASTDINTTGVNYVKLTDKEVQEYLSKIPKAAKEGVKSGKITLEDAKAAIKSIAVKQGLPPPPDQHIEQLYNVVKDEANNKMEPSSAREL